MTLTLIHELGHMYLYKIVNPEDDLLVKLGMNYTDGELQAESISFIVSKYLGLNNPFSADYILNWKGDVKKLKANMEIINTVANTIMNILDEYLKASIAA